MEGVGKGGILVDGDMRNKIDTKLVQIIDIDLKKAREENVNNATECGPRSSATLTDIKGLVRKSVRFLVTRKTSNHLTITSLPEQVFFNGLQNVQSKAHRIGNKRKAEN